MVSQDTHQGPRRSRALLTAEILKGVFADEELSTCVEAKDLIVQFLGNIFRLGEGFHASVVDDNVDLEGSARDIEILGYAW